MGDRRMGELQRGDVKPCSPSEAVERALRWVGRGVYGLGEGGYRASDPDNPFTDVNGILKCDCSRFVLFCYKLAGSRAGFNDGPWATVSDAINCDSMIEQAEHPTAKDRLFEVADRPQLGDLLVFPAIRGPDGKRLRVGHCGIVTKLCAEWKADAPQYGELEVVQCQASTRPAIKKGPGLAWLMRDNFKGLRDEAWRTRILRVG
jgi:hypothetical protein